MPKSNVAERPDSPRIQEIFKLGACILIICGCGFLSGISSVSDLQTWYIHLEKPFFNPPNFIFGPVWTMLYAAMGVTFYRLLKQNPSSGRSKALVIFCVQFILNLLWSCIFFNLHAVGLAFLEILAMLLSIVIMILWVYRVDKLASLIQIPYALWVTFASILNGAIVYLN